MPARPAERSSPVRAVKRPATGLASRFTLWNRCPRRVARDDSADQSSGRPATCLPDWPQRTLMGVVDELRSGSGKAQEGLGGKSALERHQARLYGGRRRALAGLRPHRAHACASRRRKAVEADARRTVREHARRADGQPGAAAGQGRPQGRLSFGLAGCRRREHRGRDVSRSIALPGQLRADGRAPDQQCVHARRPDPAHGGQGRHRFLRARRCRCRGRIRRRAERVRADESR